MHHFEYYAERLPLELFVLLGNFLEEIISPLPSFVVLVPAGAAAEVRGAGVWYLVWLSVIAGVGRIVAAVILYVVARKSEQALLGNNRRFFGITHADVHKVSSHLGRSKLRDWAILFLMNGTPMFPTAVLSLVCGFIHVPFRLFVGATFLGSVVNAFVYIALGYAGLKGAEQLQQLEEIGLALSILLFLIVVLIVWGWRKKHPRQGQNPDK